MNGGFSFYHEVTDDSETIDYGFLLDDARYLAQTVLYIGNSSLPIEYPGTPHSILIFLCLIFLPLQMPARLFFLCPTARPLFLRI